MFDREVGRDNFHQKIRELMIWDHTVGNPIELDIGTRPFTPPGVPSDWSRRRREKRTQVGLIAIPGVASVWWGEIGRVWHRLRSGQ